LALVRDIVAAAPRPAIFIAAAAMFAGAATLAGGETLTPAAAVTAVPDDAASFTDRFSGDRQAACAARSWPYLGSDCLRMPDGTPARPVRVIAVDGGAQARLIASTLLLAPQR
jgi:hypothetical protein